MTDALSRAIRLARTTSERVSCTLYIRREGDRYPVSTVPFGDTILLAAHGRIQRTGNLTLGEALNDLIPAQA